MTVPPEQSPPRPARRLIYLLVGIAILVVVLAVLMVLPSVVLWRTDANYYEMKNRTDLELLGSAETSFRQHYKVSYIPSRIKLSETGAYDVNDPLDFASSSYLRQVWPKLRFPIDWNGNGTNDPAERDETLEGDQCLVFFLGGIPRVVNGVPSCSGFSTNPTNPAAHISKGGDVKLFYEFRARHLTNSPHPNSKFWSYQDPFGTPYAYFSNYGKPDRYNFFSPATNTSDCAALGVWPYARGPRTASSTFPDLDYLNSSTFQIISAGPNRQFGPGSAPSGTYYWTPATAAQIGPAGSDDISNFAQNVLSAGS